jgi:uncharacterized protein (TIGR04255 family)
MATPRHLSKAPITEAVIDLKCRLAAGFDLEKFRQIEPEIAYAPPKKMQMFEFRMQKEGDKIPESTHVDHGLIGWRYASLDGKHVAQFRKDGFTFSRLEPYTTWDEIFAEASRLYRLFSVASNTDEVTRIAVRYINRMPFPEAEVGDFSPFLTTPPRCPGEGTVLLTGFLHQIQVTDPITDISATITQTVQPEGARLGHVGVILDLDVYQTGTFSPEPETILKRFGALRTAKNRYFFGGITEKAATLFE